MPYRVTSIDNLCSGFSRHVFLSIEEGARRMVGARQARSQWETSGCYAKEEHVLEREQKILPEYIDNSFLGNILGDVFCVALSSYLIYIPLFVFVSVIFVWKGNSPLIIPQN
jgi:hypothetical protein